MNEWDILEALGDIDSQLLSTPKPKKKHLGKKSRYIVLAAAAMMLLAGIALAATTGVRAKYGEKMIRLQGVSLDEDECAEQMYHTARVEFDLLCNEVKNMSWLSEQLTKAWESHEHEKSEFYSVDLMTDSGERLCFASIGEAESFFGIDLMQSAELEECIRGVYASLAVTQTERAALEFSESNKVSPDALLLYCSFERGNGTNHAFDGELVSQGGIEILVALQKNFAEHENIKYLYSHEKEGAFRESGMLTQQGGAILLLENEPCEGYAQTGYAAWCENGIGYLAHVKLYPNSHATALAVLTPVLSRIN